MSEPRLILGDCIERMAELAEASIDAVVCDPPYELNFMGRDWDRSGVAFQKSTWGEAYRVLKPGGHLLAFGGTRTVHRIAVAIEDAGFEVRDMIAWMYGSGFPKSLDVSKAIDRAAGAEREVVGYDAARARPNRTYEGGAIGNIGGTGKESDRTDNGATITAPATEEAHEWEGWGTALKPAFEPVIVARKPLAGTVAGNVLAHGVGALNIDACRIAFRGPDDEAESKEKNRHADFGTGARDNHVFGRDTRARAEQGNYDAPGRWPANVALGHHPDCVEVGTREVRGTGRTPATRPSSTFAANPQLHEEERDWRREIVTEYDCHPDCAIRLLDEQTGDLHSQDPATRNSSSPRSGLIGFADGGLNYADTGGASRFFYCAKTSRAERNAGLDGFDPQPLNWSSGDANPGSFQGDGTDRAARNNHPTVKPVELMRWLVRLVTPPGGAVLDPFLGSGTTGIAATLEGMEFVGIERDPGYMEIARARIAFWAEHGEEALRIVSDREQGERRRAEIADAGQLDLFAST